MGWRTGEVRVGREVCSDRGEEERKLQILGNIANGAGI